MVPAGLLPARFLTLTAHLVLTITLFWTCDQNVSASESPDNQTAPTNSIYYTQIIIGLSMALALFSFEIIGFSFGVSTFMSTQNLISMAAHTAGAVSLSYFMVDTWPSYYYWYIFGFTNCLPTITEILTFIVVLGCRKGFV